MARSVTRSADPRAIETRRRILEAFAGLANDEVGSPWTVSDLVGRAGLHRSSFYAHFHDIDEVVRFALDQQLDPVHEANLSRHAGGVGSGLDSNTRVIAEILERVSAPPGYLAAAVRYDRAMAEQTLGVQLRERVADYYRRVPTYRELTGVAERLSAEYIGHALSAVVCSWVAGELSTNRERLVGLISLLVPSWVMAPSAAGGPQTRGASD